MFTLTKEFSFEAAHKLPLHDGKCARLHGHSWKMRVVIRGRTLVSAGPKSGMLLDYSDISKVVRAFVDDKLDHHYLNESTELDNPTSEILARWIYDQLFQILPAGLKAVEIDETCTCSCRYEP